LIIYTGADLNLNPDVSNRYIMNTVRLCIYITLLIATFPLTSSAFRLRQMGRIPIDKSARVYGQSSGSIVISEGDSLTFYNRRSKPRGVISPDSMQSVMVADNGKFYAITEPGPEFADSAAMIVTVYDNRMTPHWGACDIREGDYYLGPSGDYLVAVTGTPGWYDFEIHVYNKCLLPVSHKIEFFEKIYFSDDGGAFFVDCGLKGGKLFNAEGKLLDSTDVQQGFDFSENGELYAFYNQGEVEVRRNGERYSFIDINKLRLKDIVVRKDINRLITAYHHVAHSHRLDNGRELWMYGPEQENSRFVSMDVSPDGRFVACGVDVNTGRKVVKEERHVQGYLYVYDIEGQGVEMTAFRYTNYTEGTPIVDFGPDSRTIYVRTAEMLYAVGIF